MRKNRQPESIVLFFPTKASTLISVEGGKALFRSLNEKIPNICNLSSLYDIIAKTSSRMTIAAITFSRQNDVGSRKRRFRCRPRLRI